MTLRPFSLLVFGVLAVIAAFTPTVMNWFSITNLNTIIVFEVIVLLSGVYVISTHEGVFLSKEEFQRQYNLEHGIKDNANSPTGPESR